MSELEPLNRLSECIVNLDFENIEHAAQDAIAAGIPAYTAVTQGMAKGMEIVGQKFEEGEYYLAELIVAADVMMKGMQVLAPYLKEKDRVPKGKVILGTVKGDLHDIGKNLVSILLEGAGFTVIDLGIDVPVPRFVETVRMENPDILGLSALLSPCIAEMKRVIQALQEVGLRDTVKVIVGGATLTNEVAKQIGADYRAKDAVDGVSMCQTWVTERNLQE
jgi:5-methyltetrahydrofolate--homocysteine methyltransferase